MRILTKSLMGVFVAASVVGTAPAYAGLSHAVPAQGYSKVDEGANFYRKKDRRYYASRDQRINPNTRISSAAATVVIAARRTMARPAC